MLYYSILFASDLKHMLKRSKHISLLLLLPVIMLFQFVQLGNMHSHQLANGKIIKHAHIYDKSDDSGTNNTAKHKHSAADYFILSLFDASSTEGFICEINLEAPEFNFQLLKQNSRPEVSYLCFSNYGLRAPPTF